MSRFLLLPILAFLVSARAETTPSAMPKVTRRDLLVATIIPPPALTSVEIKEVTLPPNFAAGLHLHPSPVVGVVQTGRIAFQVEGETVQHLGPGDAFFEPANARIARFDNEGETRATFTAFYLLGENRHELIRMLPR